MIPQKEAISQTAYYAVAVFIATVVEIPGRAMFQILNPLVAKALNEENYFELKNLYKNSQLIDALKQQSPPQTEQEKK